MNTSAYYSGPERRLASCPRRGRPNRRHRIRSESLISDCRLQQSRREEDEDGFIELPGLYQESDSAQKPASKK